MTMPPTDVHAGVIGFFRYAVIINQVFVSVSFPLETTQTGGCAVSICFRHSNLRKVAVT